jgi:hypothetical protein
MMSSTVQVERRERRDERRGNTFDIHSADAQSTSQDLREMKVVVLREVPKWN